MTDEERIAKDKEAVAKMIGAKSAMEAAQRRIELLEKALHNALEHGATALTYIPDTTYPYRSETSVKQSLKESFAKLRSVI